MVGKVSLNVGTADAGIVFVSDAVWGNMTSAQVQFMPIPTAVNTRGTYGIAVVATNHPISISTEIHGLLVYQPKDKHY